MPACHVKTVRAAGGLPIFFIQSPGILARTDGVASKPRKKSETPFQDFDIASSSEQATAPFDGHRKASNRSFCVTGNYALRNMRIALHGLATDKAWGSAVSLVVLRG